MPKKEKAEENPQWLCPYCGQKYRAPPPAGVSSRCENCGKPWYTSGIEIENRESLNLANEMEKRRKREVDADRENE